jgi:hypothetical protein
MPGDVTSLALLISAMSWPLLRTVEHSTVYTYYISHHRETVDDAAPLHGTSPCPPKPRSPLSLERIATCVYPCRSYPPIYGALDRTCTCAREESAVPSRSNEVSVAFSVLTTSLVAPLGSIHAPCSDGHPGGLWVGTDLPRRHGDDDAGTLSRVSDA